jgi:hypothetical protein
MLRHSGCYVCWHFLADACGIISISPLPDAPHKSGRCLEIPIFQPVTILRGAASPQEGNTSEDRPFQGLTQRIPAQRGSPCRAGSARLCLVYGFCDKERDDASCLVLVLLIGRVCFYRERPESLSLD